MVNDLVYGYLDESPSLHDATYFFCVDIIITGDIYNREFQNIVKNTRKKLSVKERLKIPELKFARSSENIRKEILEKLVKNNVKIVVVVVDTEGRLVADIPENYGIVVGYAISETVKIFPSIVMSLDRKYTKKHDEEKLRKILTQMVANRVSKAFLEIKMEDSSENSFIQLADFVAGAINAKYNKKDESYWKIISPAIVFEKVENWRKLKEAIKRE